MSNREIYVYNCNPIDWWEGWMPLQELCNGDTEDDWGPRNAVEEFCNQAMQIAKRDLGWEGDVIAGPYVAPLPLDQPYCEFMVAWKQENNGTTFVASPYHLPWLGNTYMAAQIERDS